MRGYRFAGRGKTRFFVVLLCAGLLAACGSSTAPTLANGGTGGGSGSSGGGSGGASSVRVLSNRADLISGGDALVQVLLPDGTPASAATVDLNGVDVTKDFSTSSDGRYMGLVSGLTPGINKIVARLPGGASSITVTNHDNGGPVISGPQLEPWVCQQGATDAKCNQPVSYSYVYLSSDPTKLLNGFQPYDPANPPTDVASTTTDNGTTVPFIVRIETGYQDRDQYQIATLYQPGQPWTANAPQPQFNHKLLITHGVSCGVDHTTHGAPSVISYAPANLVSITGGSLPVTPPTAVFADSAQYALGKGFAVMSTALDWSGHNCNLPLQAESLIMAKEHLVEQYGTLRYTIGTGCSGGSLAQQWIANAYPGIYQGILPTCSFPDAWSAATQFADYHLLLAYFLDPSKWGSGIVWDPTLQMPAVEGHISIINSEVSDQAQWSVAVPTSACSGVPAPAAGDPATRYDPETNPGGVRCDIQDAAINTLGPRLPEVWSDNEKKIGHGFAGFPIDNVGVQYGLKALQGAIITPDQFIDLNQKIGGLDVDTNPIPDRTPAAEPALANAYRSGMINEANNMDQVAIIDCRGPDPGLFHDAFRAFAIRARLDRENGTHANQLIWEGPVPIVGDTVCNQNSLIAMDRWLSIIEKDTGSKTLAQKIIADKPADLGDQCWSGVGVKLSDGLCPDVALDDTLPVLNLPILDVGVVSIYATPRMIAGDDISTDTNKCQLKPLDRNDNYGLLGFTDAQWAEMQKIFPDGVCDFSKPGVDQQPTIPWQTYQNADGSVIYGGKPLPPAPAGSGGGWAGPAFEVFSPGT